MLKPLTLRVRKVAVLGAGVMGAQIAAHLVNADVPVVLFDLPTKEGDPNGIAKNAIDNLKKLAPAPLVAKDRASHIESANYDQHLDRLRECDLVIEAIAERMDWKLDLYRRIAPCLAPHAIVASNTSGLSIEAMAEALPQDMRSRFCGIHFFNPPRYMQLVELIPLRDTDAWVVDDLEGFLTTTLGKGVIRAFDTPNFIANRVGTFSILAVMHHTQAFSLAIDEVDALTGPSIGRSRSATYRTADVVGLDTLAHVVKTMQDRLPEDPWHKYFGSPAWLSALIAKGALGQKTGGGIYRKDGKEIKVFDVAKQDYVASAGQVDAGIQAILKLKNPAEKFAQLRQSVHPQARFVWAIFRDVFHYCAYHLGSVADNARDLDLAIRWGFGWSEGPFETWQSAGWQAIANAVKEDIDAGKAMANVPLPAWVFDGRSGVHAPQGSYSARANALKPRSALAVYRRQHFPEPVLGEAEPQGKAVWENDAVRLWTTVGPGEDDVAILSFKSKLCTLGPDVVEGVIEAVARAEAGYKGLVIWQPKPPFSAGANLTRVVALMQTGDFAELENDVARFQQMSLALNYALVPTVAAVNGMALGGGCEIMMHSSRAVVALESQIGLVEAGVGLIPSGGGLKEFAVRAANWAQRTNTNDPFPFLTSVFQAISTANTSKNALDAKEQGFLRESDPVVFNPHELLYVAQQTARAMYEAGYRPKLPPRAIKVAGRNGIATLEMTLINMLEGGMISEHDYRVGKAAATGLCGGNVETGTLVSEGWLLAVERQMFVDLLKTEKTQARVKHMLETGKALRN